MKLVRYVVIVSGFCMFAGCSSGQHKEIPAEYTILQDVNDLLHSAAGPTGRPPTKLADLDRFQNMNARGYAAVKAGDVVVLWGTPLKGEGETGQNEQLVAYEKEVPTKGGYVLFSAGTVKKMSPDEFNATPKSGKK